MLQPYGTFTFVISYFDLIFPWLGHTMSVYGKPKGCVTKRSGGAQKCFLASRPGNNLIVWSCRLREAVECLKRALIPADPHEITINLKLARLHRLLEEPAEAVAYHRKVVEVCQADRKSYLVSPLI